MPTLAAILVDIAKTPGIQTIHVRGEYYDAGRGERIYDQTFLASHLAQSKTIPVIPDGMTPSVAVSGAVKIKPGDTDIVAALNANRKAKGLGPFPGKLVIARTKSAAGMVGFEAALND